jgi:hypothetical protein
MTLHEMTERAVSKGQNRKEAAELLFQGFDRHSGENLAYFLVYNNFATPAKADKIVAEHTAMMARA